MILNEQILKDEAKQAKSEFLQEMIKQFESAINNGAFTFFIPDFELLQIYILDLPYDDLLAGNIAQTFYDYLVEIGIIKTEADTQLYLDCLDEFAESQEFQDAFNYLKATIINLAENVVNAKLKRKTASAMTDTALNGVVVEGKKILQMLENMKFKIEQAARISSNDKELTKKIIQNSDMIDKIMSGLYSICFDLSNMDVLPAYSPEQINIGDDTTPDAKKNKFKLEQPQEEVEENNEEELEPSEPEENEGGSEEELEEKEENSTEESEEEPQEEEESEEK